MNAIMQFTREEKSRVLNQYNEDPQVFLLSATSRQFRIMAEIDREDSERKGVSEADKAQYLAHAQSMEDLAVTREQKEKA